MVDSIAGLGEGKVVHVVHQAPPAASTSTSTSTSSTPAAPAAPAGVPPAGGATAPQQPQQPQPQPPPFAIPGADPHVNQVFYRTWVLFLHLILIVPQLLSNILSGFGMMPGAVRRISTLIYAHLLENSLAHMRCAARARASCDSSEPNQPPVQYDAWSTATTAAAAATRRRCSNAAASTSADISGSSLSSSIACRVSSLTPILMAELAADPSHQSDSSSHSRAVEQH